LSDELLVQRAALVLLGPEFFAVLGDVGGNLLGVLALDLGVEEDLAVGDDGRAVSFAGGLAPEDLGRLLPGADDFAGGAVTAWTEPLRPVLGRRHATEEDKEGEGAQSRHRRFLQL